MNLRRRMFARRNVGNAFRQKTACNCAVMCGMPAVIFIPSLRDATTSAVVDWSACVFPAVSDSAAPVTHDAGFLAHPVAFLFGIAFVMLFLALGQTD